MATYRNVAMDFWTDSKIVDNFSPEDRYFYLYCLTNPHTNLCGCYEISLTIISRETGYNKDSVESLLKRLDSYHNVIRYDSTTKELLVLHWYRYQWTNSDKLNKPLLSDIKKVKCDRFRAYLAELYNQRPKISEHYDPEDAPKKPTPVRHKYGEYGWVRLSDDEHDRLLNQLGKIELDRCIQYVDEAAQKTGNKNGWKDWNLVVRSCHREKWGLSRGGAAQEPGTNNIFLQAGGDTF